MELVMDVALEGVVDKEVTKQVEVYKELVMDVVVEEVNRELLKEFNEGLVLVCRCGDGLVWSGNLFGHHLAQLINHLGPILRAPGHHMGYIFLRPRLDEHFETTWGLHLNTWG